MNCYAIFATIHARMAPLSFGPFAKFHYGLFLIVIFLDVPLFLSSIMSYFIIIWNMFFTKYIFKMFSTLLHAYSAMISMGKMQDAMSGDVWRVFIIFKYVSWLHVFVELWVGTVYFINLSPVRHNLAPIQNFYSDLTSFKPWQNSML